MRKYYFLTVELGRNKLPEESTTEAEEEMPSVIFSAAHLTAALHWVCKYLSVDWTGLVRPSKLVVLTLNYPSDRQRRRLCCAVSIKQFD